MINDWLETLTSRSLYNTRSNLTMYWWPWLPTLWEDLCPEQPHLLAPKGLTPQHQSFRIRALTVSFWRSFIFTVITRWLQGQLRLLIKVNLSLCQAFRAWSQQLHHILLGGFLMLVPTARDTTSSWSAGIMLNPTKSEKKWSHIIYYTLCAKFWSLPKPYQCYLHHAW